MRCYPQALLLNSLCASCLGISFKHRFRCCQPNRLCAVAPILLSSSRNLGLCPCLGFANSSYTDVIFLLMSSFQSLDYDRCINDPYLEVLETMDNKVSPSSIS